MITNDRQYRITRAQLERFTHTLESFDVNLVAEKTKSLKLAKAELDAINSESESLASQVQEYELLRSGSVEVLKANSLEELPNILIKARIAKGLTQRKLAELLNLKEQQIQKYEAEEYATAKLNRLAAVAKALNLNISEVAEFKSVATKDDALGLDWGKFPIREMYLRNWLDFSGSLSMALANSRELAKEYVLTSFGRRGYAATRQRVPSKGESNEYALIAWQCRLIKLAEKIQLGSFNRSVISEEWLSKLVKLSTKPNGPVLAVEHLAKAGIRLVIVPHLANTYLDGAAVMLKDGPVVGLTLRYDRADSFWFVLLHELIHIKDHLAKDRTEIIFDDLDDISNDFEVKTDVAAAEALLPQNIWDVSLPRYIRTKEAIQMFSTEYGISIAIIAGRIRREAKDYTIFTDMVGQGEIRKLFPQVDFSY